MGVYDEFWQMLPFKDDWRQIASTLNDEQSIDRYVSVYRQPFLEYQQAERDQSIPTSTLRSCLSSAVTLMHKAVSSFNMDFYAFSSKDRKTYDEVIQKAIYIFDDPTNPQVQPVFKVQSLKKFTFQRLDDMLLASASFDQMRRNQQNILLLLHAWESRVKKRNDRELRNLVIISMDLDKAKRKVVEGIKVMKRDSRNEYKYLKAQRRIERFSDVTSRGSPKVVLGRYAQTIVAFFLALALIVF